MSPTVKALYFYPLKSAQGISCKQLEVMEKGPVYDREWMIIDDKNLFTSQRTQPLLSQIKTQITSEHLILSADNFDELKIDLKTYGSNELQVKIFSHWTPAQHLSFIYDQWISDYLGKKHQVVRAPQKTTRTTSGRNGPQTPIHFPDGYPFLLTSIGTLNELNQKLESPVTMDRFRPNVVIEGLKANEEDAWTELTINDVHFLSVKACSRCSIIDIDPKTAKKTNPITKTLKSYRTKEGQVIFGNNLSHTNLGTINVGDTLLFK